MSLDILAPIHIKKIKETGTIGIIDTNDWDSDAHYFVDPDFLGMVDNESFVNLNGSGSGVKDRTGVFVGDSYYVYCGEDTNFNYTGEFLMYRVTNPATGAGSWFGLSAGVATKESCLVTDGTRLWAYGGYRTNMLQRYTITNNATGAGYWEHLGYGGQPLQTHHYACIYNGYLYTYGGNNGEPVTTTYKELWRFDLTKNDASGWVRLTDGLYSCSGHIMVPWNNKLYVFGGYSTVAKPPYTQIYDIVTNTWSLGSYCPFTVTESEGCIYQDKCYIHRPTTVNGFEYNSIFVYDFIGDYWSKRISGGRRHFECSFAVHQSTGNMYIYGTAYSNILDMWKINNMALAIRKVQ